MASKPSDASPFAAMGQTIDFMQKLWGGAGLPTPGNLASLAGMPQRMPSMLAPTVDLDELDKRIADLRAVEQWLELNANMLRTTIQTLEVQRATIATLKGIGGAMFGPMMAPPAPRQSAFTAPAVPPEVAAGLAAAAGQPMPEPTPPASKARHTARPATHAPSLADEALNPAAWWHTLQDQFAKIAAVATEPAPTERKPAKRPAKRRSAKR
jgi:hypothetical protein